MTIELEPDTEHALYPDISQYPDADPKPLCGWRVLIPRGGPWGYSVAATLRVHGANPLVAPMINFAPANDQNQLGESLKKLVDGFYDWITITSATTVEVLESFGVVIPSTTRVAAVGETSAAALALAGYQVDLVPLRVNSAKGLLEEWPEIDGAPQRVLALRSAIAKRVLSVGLEARGHLVDAVVAYRTVGVPVEPEVVEQVRSGAVQAMLVTSGSVAEQIAKQFGEIPASTLVASIGPVTMADAQARGVRVDVVAKERSTESLIEAVISRAENSG